MLQNNFRVVIRVNDVTKIFDAKIVTLLYQV